MGSMAAALTRSVSCGMPASALRALIRALAAAAMHQLPNLKGCDVHSTVLLSNVDTSTLNRLGMYLTCDPVYEEEDRKYHKQ